MPRGLLLPRGLGRRRCVPSGHVWRYDRPAGKRVQRALPRGLLLPLWHQLLLPVRVPRGDVWRGDGPANERVQRPVPHWLLLPRGRQPAHALRCGHLWRHHGAHHGLLHGGLRRWLLHRHGQRNGGGKPLQRGHLLRRGRRHALGHQLPRGLLLPRGLGRPHGVRRGLLQLYRRGGVHGLRGGPVPVCRGHQHAANVERVRRGLLLPRGGGKHAAGGVPARLFLPHGAGGGHHEPLRRGLLFGGRRVHGRVHGLPRGRLLPRGGHRAHAVPPWQVRRAARPGGLGGLRYVHCGEVLPQRRKRRGPVRRGVLLRGHGRALGVRRGQLPCARQRIGHRQPVRGKQLLRLPVGGEHGANGVPWRRRVRHRGRAPHALHGRKLCGGGLQRLRRVHHWELLPAGLECRNALPRGNVWQRGRPNAPHLHGPLHRGQLRGHGQHGNHGKQVPRGLLLRHPRLDGGDGMRRR